MRTLLFSIIIALVANFTSNAADVAGSKDYPGVKRVEGSEILFYTTKDFDEFRIALSPIKWNGSKAAAEPYEKKTLEGRPTKIYYAAPAGVSVLEVYRNYENELKAAGFEILFSARGEELETRGYNNQIAREIFKITKPYGTPEESADWMLSICDDSNAGYIAARKTTESGAELYVSAYVFPNSDPSKNFFEKRAADRVVIRVDALEIKAMQQRMVLVTSDEMSNQISSSGRIALYGIYFDSNKTDLKSESAPTLEQIAKLLKDKPTLKLLVVGHTDSVGTFEFNRDLSQRRAAAVVDALKSQHGISSERLFPFGVSYAAPTSTNESEDGRAKNRRVELVEFKQ